MGVSHQVKVEGLAEKENDPEIYVPIAQNPWFWAAVAVRTEGDPLSMVAAVKAAVARIDKQEPLTRIRTMDQVLAESVAEPRFRAGLTGAFAAIALALAAVGIFGVLAFSVSQRTREFGIRMALGAQSADVLRMVMRDALKITAAGVAAGLLLAAALTRWLAALLFGVQPHDLVTFVGSAALLAMVALIACAAPALRAARVDPAVALQHESSGRHGLFSIFASNSSRRPLAKNTPLRSWLRSEPGPEGAPFASGFAVAPNLTLKELQYSPAPLMLPTPTQFVRPRNFSIRRGFHCK